MDLHPRDVVLIEVAFHQTQGAKIRPAVVVLDSGDEDFIAAPITTRVRTAEFDMNLAGWQVAGLKCAIHRQGEQGCGLDQGGHPPSPWQTILQTTWPPFARRCAGRFAQVRSRRSSP